MAALDIPWLSHMSTPRSSAHQSGGDENADSAGNLSADNNSNSSYPFGPGAQPPPTYAAFSSTNPAVSSSNLSAAKRRSTILVHQKSPLLLATPPQVTRALAYSHPFLLPLNKLVGLLTWTTGDPWESFLLLATFWAVVLYGDVVVRWAGPVVTVLGIVAGMYGRRYSPLSSSGWGAHPSWSSAGGAGGSGGAAAGATGKGGSDGMGNKKGAGGKANTAAGNGTPGTVGTGAGNMTGQHQRNASELTNTRHQKTLDEIVETLKLLTSRCNILLEPLLEMTDFLSTQRTATSATTRPALTTLFVRILGITPFWIALTLPPLRIISTKRVVLVFGTLVMTWHSRVCRVSRTVLWRSATVRWLARAITGLEFEGPKKPTVAGAAMSKEKLPGKPENSEVKGEKSQSKSALTAALRGTHSTSFKAGNDTGVRFTFILYENQRRWVGLGWTNTLFAYERAAWTDEHNNSVPPKAQFELPEVEADTIGAGDARWRWVKGSKWKVDGVPGEVPNEDDYDGEAGRMGWVYYDTKWNTGRRGQDGWGKWTRRRKWYRDAELVEFSGDEDDDYEEEGPKDGDKAHSGAYGSSSSPPPPSLPPRTTAAESAAAQLSTSAPDSFRSHHSQASSDPTRDEEADNVSMLSTSSKSTSRWKFPGVGGGASNTKSSSAQPSVNKAPSLRRRTTGGSAGRRSRRASESAGADEGMDSRLEMEIQESRREREGWGVGDELTMGLD